MRFRQGKIRKGMLDVLKSWSFLVGVITAVLGGSCPSQPWNVDCPRCCENAWLSCRCRATGLVTGYDVPCCRNGAECRACVAYPGCSVFDNCRECVVRLPGGYRYPDNDQRFCTRCNTGWAGSMCRGLILSECGGLFKSERGVIEIEGYPDDVNCTWTIDVTRNSLVRLKFERFDVENDPYCTYDALQIFDGGNVQRALAVTLCGPAAPPSFTSRHHHVVLKFKSDESGNFGGFRIRFTRLDVCTRQPCLNKGRCVVTGSTTFRCVCAVGFFGRNCELPVRCRQPVLTSLLNYAFDDKLLTYGSKLTYRCGSDRRLVGSPIALCTKHGQWSNPPPICVPIDDNPARFQTETNDLVPRNTTLVNSTTQPSTTCTEPLSPTGGYVTVNRSPSNGTNRTFYPGVSITFHCNETHVLVGTHNSSCDDFGVWSNFPPKCLRTCPKPGLTAHGRTTTWHPPHARSVPYLKRILVTGSVVKVRCAPMMRLSGVSRRVCLPSGELSGERHPKCKPRCGIDLSSSESTMTSPVAWHVTIRRRNRVTSEWTVHCNGAFVGDRVVLTSASCLAYSSTNLAYQLSDLKVHIGNIHNTSSWNTSHTISRIFLHRDFDPILHYNDIAIIVLESQVSVSFGSGAWPVCMTSRSGKLAMTRLYTSTFVPGSTEFAFTPSFKSASVQQNISFAYNGDQSSNQSTSMVQTEQMTRVPNKLCNTHGQNARKRFCMKRNTQFREVEFQLPGKPLVAKKWLLSVPEGSSVREQWVLIGISSGRPRCIVGSVCYESFVKVRPYLDWIKRTAFRGPA